MRADTWDGVADINNPPVARLYLEEFDRCGTPAQPSTACAPPVAADPTLAEPWRAARL